MLNRLCIIGVGLIGGSFALSLREAGLVREVVGVDRDLENLRLAEFLGLIDRGAASLEEGVEGADCVFIAVPVGVMPAIFRGLAPLWQNDTVYCDAGSTKRDVLAALESVFGEVPSNFVPGHPIAGAENSGASAARAGLFSNRRVILTPVAGTRQEALELIRTLWESVGSRVSLMEATRHDQVLAATSHLPHVLSFALTSMLGKHDEKQEIFTYAAGGLRDFTRIAGSDPAMWRDISLANRDQLLPLIEEYRDALADVAKMLADEDADRLVHLFADANQARKRFIDQLDK
jgi:prephenate dehydrogenase